MALIVETGSIVAGANTLVSLSDYELYADTLGIVLTGDTDIQLIKAMNYINDNERFLKGSLVNRDQTTAYPRTGLMLEGWWWTSTEIPRQAIQAQKALAIDLNAGIDLYNRPEPEQKVTKMERVEGVVTVEYAVLEGGNKKVSNTTTSMALMAVLKNSNGLSLIRA
jgi:hypothetical protein